MLGAYSSCSPFTHTVIYILIIANYETFERGPLVI